MPQVVRAQLGLALHVEPRRGEILPVDVLRAGDREAPQRRPVLAQRDQVGRVARVLDRPYDAVLPAARMRDQNAVAMFKRSRPCHGREEIARFTPRISRSGIDTSLQQGPCSRSA